MKERDYLWCLLNQLLDDQEELDQLCPTCRERFDRNPLRVLDCKEEGCKALVKDAPSMLDMLCDECREHFETLQTLLTARGIPFKVDTHIVRGLDYYTRTVFEFESDALGAQAVDCGGGRYDTLIGNFGKDLSAVGIAISTPRVLSALVRQKKQIDTPRIDALMVMRPDFAASYRVAQALRGAGYNIENYYADASGEAALSFAQSRGVEAIVTAEPDGTAAVWRASGKKTIDLETIGKEAVL